MADERKNDDIELSPRLERLAEEYAKDPTSRKFLPLAEEYRASRMYDEAIYICKEGLKSHPQFVPARISLARCYFESGEREDALAMLLSLTDEHPENIPALRLLGEVYFELNDADKSIQTYRRVLSISPADQVAAEKLREMGADSAETTQQMRSPFATGAIELDLDQPPAPDAAADEDQEAEPGARPVEDDDESGLDMLEDEESADLELTIEEDVDEGIAAIELSIVEEEAASKPKETEDDILELSKDEAPARLEETAEETGEQEPETDESASSMSMFDLEEDVGEIATLELGEEGEDLEEAEGEADVYGSSGDGPSEMHHEEEENAGEEPVFRSDVAQQEEPGEEPVARGGDEDVSFDLDLDLETEVAEEAPEETVEKGEDEFDVEITFDEEDEVLGDDEELVLDTPVDEGVTEETEEAEPQRVDAESGAGSEVSTEETEPAAEPEPDHEPVMDRFPGEFLEDDEISGELVIEEEEFSADEEFAHFDIMTSDREEDLSGLSPDQIRVGDDDEDFFAALEAQLGEGGESDSTVEAAGDEADTFPVPEAEEQSAEAEEEPVFTGPAAVTEDSGETPPETEEAVEVDEPAEEKQPAAPEEATADDEAAGPEEFEVVELDDLPSSELEEGEAEEFRLEIGQIVTQGKPPIERMFETVEPEEQEARVEDVVLDTISDKSERSDREFLLAEEEATEIEDDEPPVFETEEEEASPQEEPVFRVADEQPAAPERPAGPDDVAPVTPSSARVYESQGHFAKALEIYRSLLQENPENSTYSLKVRELEKKISQPSVDTPRQVEILRRWLSNIEAFREQTAAERKK